MAENPPKEHSEPALRVVDRRHWARPEGETPSGDAGGRKPSYVEDLERQVAEHGARVLAVAAEHRQALGEFEQAKVRIRRDVAREVERGKRAVLVELLDVLDNLDRALAAARPAPGTADAPETLTRGVELVRDQFLAKLAGFGVTRVDTLGQGFDATRHEAVTTTPVDDPAQDGAVVAVMKEGYAIGDDILRPAAVVVGKK